MIIIHGEMEIGADSAAAFIPLTQELVDKTRAEEGCHLYTFARDIENPQLFRIAEEWESEDALAAHMKADHYRAYGRALGDIEVKRVSIIQFSASDRTVLV